MAFERFYITNKGSALLAKAQIGEQLVYTRAAAGDGEIGKQSPTALNDIINKITDLGIAQLDFHKPKIASAQIRFSNKDIQAPFYWREIGLYAKGADGQEILYAYGNAGEKADFIPSYGTTPTEFVFLMDTIIGNATNVTAVIDDSLIYATKDDLKSKVDLVDGVVPPTELPAASHTTLGAVKLSADFNINPDGTLSIDKGKIGGTGTVPVTVTEDQVAVELEFPIKFNSHGEVIATDDDSGTGIISLESISGRLEFVARNVL